MKKTSKAAGKAVVPAASARAASAGTAPKDDARFDLGWIRSLSEILVGQDLEELELELGEGRIRLRRGGAHTVVHHAPVATHAPAPVAHAPAAAPAKAAPVEAEGSVYVTSPFVGTFYRAPSPEAALFVEVGQQVKKGQVLCIVEALKLMNEIEAEVDGVIAAALVENGQAVEFGEPLFKLRPA